MCIRIEEMSIVADTKSKRLKIKPNSFKLIKGHLKTTTSVKPLSRGIEDVLSLLSKWDLAELHDIFIGESLKIIKNQPIHILSSLEHEITIRALKCLDNEEIAELIPKIGPRTVFKSLLNAWKEKVRVKSKHQPAVVSIESCVKTPKVQVVSLLSDPLAGNDNLKRIQSEYANANAISKWHLKSETESVDFAKSKPMSDYHTEKDDEEANDEFLVEELEHMTQDTGFDNTPVYGDSEDMHDDEWHNLDKLSQCSDTNDEKPKRAKRQQIKNPTVQDISQNLMSVTKIKLNYIEWDGKQLVL